MKRVSLLLVCGLLLLDAGAAEAGMLAPSEIDASRLLPPPPALGSPKAVAELAELHAIAARSTPEMVAAARHDDGDEKPDMFNEALGFDVTTLPATTKLLTEVIEEEDTDTGPAKKYFHRSRPWIIDSSIPTCVMRPPGPAANSYPSGHATLAFSMGVVLAALLPDKAQAILQRASQFAENRLVCGMHFRSDIIAGQQFGSLIGVALMHNATFEADYDAAAAELKAAGKTAP